jgi:hypothetical protein
MTRLVTAAAVRHFSVNVPMKMSAATSSTSGIGNPACFASARIHGSSSSRTCCSRSSSNSPRRRRKAA